MQRIIHDKLVRDRIPEIIESSGKIAETSLLSPDEMDTALDRKLQEEVREFLDSHDSEEIADILEVLREIAVRRGYNWDEVEASRVRKREARGGFSKGVFLHAVESGQQDG